jgi:hypothetical protein
LRLEAEVEVGLRLRFSCTDGRNGCYPEVEGLR